MVFKLKSVGNRVLICLAANTFPTLDLTIIQYPIIACYSPLVQYVLESCEDCYTEDKLCNGVCGRKLESKLDDNVIEFIPNVVLEHSCKILCLDDIDCLYYTHYGKDNDHYPDLCVLLSDIKAPFQECEHCDICTGLTTS